jgi:membrane associated rhomboid family serine protease
MIPLRDTAKSRFFPAVTLAIIVANVMMFLYETSLSSEGLQNLILTRALIPARLWYAELSGGQRLEAYLSIPTSMFLHGGWLHVLGNMWMLWIFGDNVEDRLGRGRFLVTYFLWGALAAGAHVAIDPRSEIPTLGASGAVAGVLGAYFVFFPRSRVLTLIPLFILIYFVEVPAAIFLGIWFLVELARGSGVLFGGSASQIAFFAHIGGFVSGVATAWLWKHRPG